MCIHIYISQKESKDETVGGEDVVWKV
jgi:hypothetical protein